MFLAYLSVYLLVCLGWESLIYRPWVRKHYWVENFIQDAELRKLEEKA